MCSLVIFYGNPSYSECCDNIGYVKEVYAELEPFILLFQGERETFERVTADNPGAKFFFGGEQVRTIEELVLSVCFNDSTIQRVIDGVADEVWSLNNSVRMFQIRNVICSYYRVFEVDPRAQYALEAIKAADNAVDLIKPRANYFYEKIISNIKWYKMLLECEFLFVRGGAKVSKGSLASVSISSVGENNGFFNLIEWYRDIRDRNVFDNSIVEGRIEVLLALNVRLDLSDKLAICRYLLVQSAYFFSIGKMYLCESEYNTAALFFFRSFETIAWVIGVRKGFVKVTGGADHLEPTYEAGVFSNNDDLEGKRVLGVGQLWSVFRAYHVSEDKALGTGLTAFVTMRNKSVLGHGFLHLSKNSVESAGDEVFTFLKECLDDEDFNFWKHYKYSSRSVTFGDFGRLKDVSMVSSA